MKLNSNHSCFILVENENEGRFGGEIEFRTNFEQFLRENYKIPLILIVLEGGTGTIKTVADALEHSTPILYIDVLYLFLSFFN
jgi:transient receptor potential cation channel subfamily M protein 2